MDSFSTQIIVLLVLVVANGLFSMAEIAIVSSRKTRLQQRAEEGDEGARIALELANSPGSFLSTIQIGITLVGILAGAYGGATIADRLAPELNRIAWIAPHGAAVSLSAVVLGITFLTLILGELVPKQIALQHAERLAAAFAPVMRTLAWVAAPLVRLLSFTSTLVLRLFAIKPSTETSVTEEEVKLMIEQGTQEGVFEPTEQEMVERVFRLGDRTVSAIMTPRPDVVWLDVNDPPEEIQRKITSSSHTHYPVAEDEIDRVIGMVNTKDLLSQHLGCRPTDLRAVLRPALFIPETMSALAVLERFKKKRTHVAVVIDEHGGFQGLVTTSDVLEAIVGDIPTPEEDDEEEILRREDGSYLMDGKVPADELKEVLDLDELPYEEENLYQTLGGMVMAYLDRIPRAGDSFAWKGFRFEVVDMDGHRVDKVLVRPEPGEPEPAEQT
ncbi:MAG: hemolysin family protein [Desulfobacterales bacterium]